MNIINERKSDEEESKLFEILQRIPGELQKTARIVLAVWNYGSNAAVIGAWGC
ncbi:MAG: hypothetical protein HFG83_06715 [Dorea sp.]|nr:hypothetical protein [Dorea sp.]MCI9453508.1 hypothetical protein [Dorea sp.]